MSEPDFARMPRLAQAGILALCLLAGAVLGFVGTFFHQSLPPVGAALALVTVVLLLAGLRIWAGVRGPAAAGSAGVALVSAMLAAPGGSSVLVPANGVGYAWLIGVVAIAFVVLAWPNIPVARASAADHQRPPRSGPDTMEQTPEEKDRAQP